MKKTIIAVISLILTFIMVSYATAVPYSNSKPITDKIEEIEKCLSFLDDKTDREKIHQLFEKYLTSDFSKIIGVFYIIAGLISLYFTLLIIMMGFVAITFNPGGIFVFFMAIFPAILTVIFLNGGISLLLSDNPVSDVNRIIFLSFVLFITWIILRLNNISFIDILIPIIVNILDILRSIFNNPKLNLSVMH